MTHGISSSQPFVHSDLKKQLFGVIHHIYDAASGFEVGEEFYGAIVDAYSFVQDLRESPPKPPPDDDVWRLLLKVTSAAYDYREAVRDNDKLNRDKCDKKLERLFEQVDVMADRREKMYE